jgi:hypothetical protein
LTQRAICTIIAPYLFRSTGVILFSSKLKADYIELINSELDNIPIEDIGSFVLVQNALRNILVSNDECIIPKNIKELIENTEDLLNSPEQYVEKESDFEEFKSILRERITKKIEEFELFTQSQKEAYIQNQQTKEKQVFARQEEGQDRVRNLFTPEASLARLFSRISDINRDNPQLSRSPTRKEILDSLRRCLGVTGIEPGYYRNQITFSELNSFLLLSSSAIFKEACSNYYVIVPLLGTLNIKPNTFFNLDESIRQELCDNDFSVRYLVEKAKISQSTLLSLNENIRQELYANYESVCHLTQESNIPLNNLLSLDEIIRQEMYQNHEAVNTLTSKAGLPLGVLLLQSDSTRKILYDLADVIIMFSYLIFIRLSYEILNVIIIETGKEAVKNESHCKEYALCNTVSSNIVPITLALVLAKGVFTLFSVPVEKSNKTEDRILEVEDHETARNTVFRVQFS